MQKKPDFITQVEWEKTQEIPYYKSLLSYGESLVPENILFEKRDDKEHGQHFYAEYPLGESKCVVAVSGYTDFDSFKREAFFSILKSCNSTRNRNR